MLRTITHYWWMILLRCIFAILFGIAAIIWPGPTIEVLVLLFGAYALVDGIFAVIVGIQQYGETQRWWAALLEGIAGIVLGVLTLVWPGTTATVLLAFIAAWAIVTGVFEIAAMRAQMQQASERRKAQIERRTSEVRADYEARSAKLAQARQLVKEAMSR